LTGESNTHRRYDKCVKKFFRKPLKRRDHLGCIGEGENIIKTDVN
jgi:hypothetical protein